MKEKCRLKRRMKSIIVDYVTTQNYYKNLPAKKQLKIDRKIIYTEIIRITKITLIVISRMMVYSVKTVYKEIVFMKVVIRTLSAILFSVKFIMKSITEQAQLDYIRK